MPSLFTELTDILDEISKQIPIATNCTFGGLTQERYQRSHQEYELYRYMNDEFPIFLKNNSISAKEINSHHKQLFKNNILKEYAIFIEKCKRLQSEEYSLLLTELFDYFSKNMDQLIDQLCQGKILSIKDEATAYKIEKDIVLTEHRAIVDDMMNANVSILSNNGLADENRDIILKSNCFIIGSYFDRLKLDVGFCEEYACLGLKKIFDRDLLDNDTVIEKISINGSYDGHTFLVFNRDPNSQLNDISTWGKNAILFDPWNKLVCRASDLLSCPKEKQMAYPKECEWVVEGKFDKSDSRLLNTLVELDNYFDITGNDKLETRAHSLIEEYELTPLDTPQFESLHKYLIKLLKEVWPDNFKLDIKLFITTGGNELITTIPGFKEPVIAIHKDFLLNSTVEELKFGLAQTIHYIKKNGLGIKENDTAMEQHSLDKAALQKFKDGQAAIRFLRNGIEFKKNNNKKIKMPNLVETNIPATYEQRIRNLMTVFAEDKTLSQDGSVTAIDESILSGVKNIPKKTFFTDNFNTCKTNVEKLCYLTQQLSELHKELLPFEVIHSPSIRVREFCRLLSSIKINHDDSSEVAALDRLISVAFELRIPAFELIYLTSQGKTLEQYDRSEVKPLGIFKVFQLAIDRFLRAENISTAKSSALEIKKLYEALKPHFDRACFANRSNWYLQAYRKANQNKFPKGSDRYFGSELGTRITWKKFPENEKDLPWQKHLTWIKEFNDRDIAEALMLIGINLDKNVWQVFTPLELFQMADQAKLPIATEEGEQKSYGTVSDHVFGCHIVHFISQNHKMVQTKHDSFEQTFISFYDNNWPALISPGFVENQNTDNECVNYLLNQFTQIALNGTKEEKQVVKDFFMGRKDGKDLKNLCKHPEDLARHRHLFTYKVPFIKFALTQEYQGKKFDLFSQEEICSLIRQLPFHRYETPPTEWSKLFKLNYTDVTLPCVIELIHLIIENKLNNCLCPILLINHHLEHHSKYTLLSPEALHLLKLTTDEKFPCHDSLRTVVKSLEWSTNNLETIDVHDLVLLYRAIDLCFIFPSPKEQKKFNDCLIDKINLVSDIDDKIKLLETLLFTSKKFNRPITHIQFNNSIIDMWVSAIHEKYEEDIGTDEYFNVMTKVINRVFQGAAARDRVTILSRLTTKIESQRKVNDYIGQVLEPEKYFFLKENKLNVSAISSLGAVSSYLSKEKEDQVQFLDFLSSPLNQQSVDQFTQYLLSHNKAEKIRDILIGRHYANVTKENEKEITGKTLVCLHDLFWDRSLQERALIIDYLLIPADTVISDDEIKKAYDSAFIYVAKKLFVNSDVKGSDDEFALSFFKAYLDVADKYTRNLILSGMLVASNEIQENKQKISVGKKLALICEHMGPAYIKLAQAIHSHPATSEEIKEDLKHVKGKAKPPERWELQRMITENLSAEDKARIKRMGPLLGCASYNIAVQVELADKSQKVLTLLRENAATDAKKGFDHLERAIAECKHTRLNSSRSSILSMINEARDMSEVEMNDVKSSQQFAIASRIYKKSMKRGKYTINIYPASLIKNGKGYRIIDLIPGTEFNHLKNSPLKTMIAKEMVELELEKILSGKFFDSDRHGNQLRVDVNEATNMINIGLYDFGEMALKEPTLDEINLLAEVINDTPFTAIQTMSFIDAFDATLSDHIEKHSKDGSAHYLMRVRKALLALHDFQQHLSTKDLMDILINITKSNKIHPAINNALMRYSHLLNFVDSVYQAADYVRNTFSLFTEPSSSIDASTQKVPHSSFSSNTFVTAVF